MKKTYCKPEILFEDFSLSTSIAAGCEVTTNFARNSCPLKDSVFGNIFIEGMALCTRAVKPETDFNGICYDVPTEANNVFNS